MIRGVRLREDVLDSLDDADVTDRLTLDDADVTDWESLATSLKLSTPESAEGRTIRFPLFCRRYEGLYIGLTDLNDVLGVRL